MAEVQVRRENMGLPSIARAPPPYHGYSRNQIKLLSANTVYLPGLNRDPILGRKKSKRNAFIKPQEHTGGVFINTGHYRNYYVINPEWGSESSSCKHTQIFRRQSYGYDRRPAVQPLARFYLPELTGSQTARPEYTQKQNPDINTSTFQCLSAREPYDYNKKFLSEGRQLSTSLQF